MQKLWSAYFVDGVDDSARFFPSETQGDFPVLLNINEIGYLLAIGEFGVPRSEMLPPPEDAFFCSRVLLITVEWGRKAGLPADIGRVVRS
jgi:hypothetical protein